jgi:hypothetical protein
MTTLSSVVSLLRKTAGGLMIFLFPSCYGPGEEVLAGRTLPARSRTEMAREALIRGSADQLMDRLINLRLTGRCCES